jgi:hypothetical protein
LGSFLRFGLFLLVVTAILLSPGKKAPGFLLAGCAAVASMAGCLGWGMYRRYRAEQGGAERPPEKPRTPSRNRVDDPENGRFVSVLGEKFPAGRGHDTMNRILTAFLRFFGFLLMVIGLVGVFGVFWQFEDRYTIHVDKNSAVAGAFVSQPTPLLTALTDRLERSALHWLVTGMGAVICALTIARPAAIQSRSD